MSGIMKTDIQPGVQNMSMSIARVAAKIKLNIKIKENSGIKISNYTIYSVPFKTFYTPHPMDTEASEVDKGAGSGDIASLWGDFPKVTLADGTTSVSKLFYMYENRRGVNTAITTQKDKNEKNAPVHATYVTIEGEVNKVKVVWRVYLGANNTSNFNIKRNCFYTYNITLNDAATADTRVNVDYTNAIDLTASGKTANCYLTSQTNTWYKFKANVRGNGAATSSLISYTGSALSSGALISPTSAELVWETGGHGQIVQGVSYKNGYVYFKSGPMTEGNAVIAVKDAKNVLWSWHIWKTHFDVSGMPTQVYKTNPRTMKATLYGNVFSSRNLTMMDRNLGAADNTPSNTETVVNTFGLLYQFGRKDPFPGMKARGIDPNTVYDMINVYNNSGTLLNTKALTSAPYQVVNSSVASTAASVNIYGILNYAVQHPLTFILQDDNDKNTNTNTNKTSSENWVYGAHTNTTRNEMSHQLWGGYFTDKSSTLALNGSFSGKTIYDPCPIGWCMPPQETWTNFTKNVLNDWGDYNIDGGSSGGTFFKFFNTISDEQKGWPTSNGGFAAAPVFGRRLYINGTSGVLAFYPATGNRFGVNGNLLATQAANVWSSSSRVASLGVGSHLNLYPNSVYPVAASSKSYGFSVRCVREDSLQEKEDSKLKKM